MTRLAITKLRKLEAAQARRDGTDGRLRPLTPATTEALRAELMFGRPGPMFGSGPAKAQLVALFVDNMGTGATSDAAYKDRFHALAEQARAHYEAEHGLPHLTSKAELRERVKAFYGPKLRSTDGESP